MRAVATITHRAAALGIGERARQKQSESGTFIDTRNQAFLALVQRLGFTLRSTIFEGGRRVVRASNKAEARKRWVKSLVGLIFDGIGG